jgi:hypothetical protein
MLAVLARLASPEIAGQYALGIAVSAPILVLVQFRRREPGAADIRITSLALSLLGIAAIGFLNHSLQDRLALLLVVLAEAVEWIADVYAGQRGLTSQSLHGILPLMALAVTLQRSGHLGAALLAVVVMKLLVLFCYDFRKPRGDRQPEDRESSVSTLAANVPCYFIAHMLGLRSLGIFAAIQSFAPVADAVVRELGRRMTPQLTRMYDEGDRPGFSRMSAQMGGAGLMLAFCGVICAAIAGSWLLSLLFGAPYAGEPSLLLALSAAAGASFVVTLLGYVLSAARRGADRLPLEVLAVAGTSMASIALVAKSGLMARRKHNSPASAPSSRSPANCVFCAPSCASPEEPRCWLC